MPRRAAKRSPQASREDILEAATACFAERGYHLTKVDDIAERAGLSKGAVYWHFANKRDLFLALLDQETYQRMAPALASGADAPDGPSAIHRISEAFLAQAPTSLPVIELTLEYLAQASRDDELRGRLELMYQAFSDQLSAIVEQGVQEGTFRDVGAQEAAGFIAATLDGLLLQKVVRPEMDLPAMWRAAEDLIMEGLLKK